MKTALFLMIAAGVAIGVSLPTGQPQGTAPIAADVTDAPAAAKPVDTVLQRTGGGHFVAFADVNGATVRFLVDTGASTVALTQEDARRAHVDFDPGQFQVVGRGASGEVRGQVVQINEVTLDGKKASGITGIVLENSELSLLGQSYLRRLKVQIDGDTMTLS